MNDKKEFVYKRKYLPIITSCLLLIMMLSISFAFFTNNSYGTKNLAVEYGKIFMNLNELSEGASLTNLYPKTDEEGINQRTSFDFSVSGYNSGSKRLYYDIFAVQGSNISEKTRFNDNEISIYLTDNLGNILYGPSPATGLSEDGCELIKMRSILGGDDENLIIHNYILKVWLNDSVVISNTETYIPNKTIYTTSQIKNKYFSVKIKVEGYFLDEGAFQIFSDVLLEPSNIKGTIAYGAPGNEEGLYYWEEENKYIYRGGLIKINSSGLDVGDYENDTDDGNELNNYVKVPWEEYGENENCTDKENNKCWRIVSINSDNTITIIRDRNIGTQIFDNTHNTEASISKNRPDKDYGYNDFLENTPTPGHPEEYRPYSMMYTRIYGEEGYQNTVLSDYLNLLSPITVCLNKVDNYKSLNYETYETTSRVKSTCDVTGKSRIVEVTPLENVYVRLPYAEEFLNASLEVTCYEDYQHECRNKNYMYNKSHFALANSYASESWYIRCVVESGYVERSSASGKYGVRPVVTLKSTILISGGTGTALDPYIIES